MKKAIAETVRTLCAYLDGCDTAWEGISYSAFYQDDELTRMAVETQITHLDTTIARLREIHAALTPVNHAALKRILKRIEDE